MPWIQRNDVPPVATPDSDTGRPKLNAGAVRHRLRLAIKELGGNPTNAQLAEHLQISERTLSRWQLLSGLRAVSADARPAGS